MSWVRIWVHLVFATKNRGFYLEKDSRKEFFKHIKENADNKGIWMDCVNGYSEHAHCLISLDKDQSLSNTVQLIKGESSWWINKNKIISEKFKWQDDYWAASISDSHLKFLRKYIHNQESHHNSATFKEELEHFIEMHGLFNIKI